MYDYKLYILGLDAAERYFCNWYNTISKYLTCFNVRWKTDGSQLCLPYEVKTKKYERRN